MNGSDVWMNGKFLPASDAKISVFDRSFQLGDGLFDAIRVHGGGLFRMKDHLDRLRRGADALDIRIPYGCKELEAVAIELVRRSGVGDGMVRVHVSRGVGRRGYSPRGAESPSVVMTLHGLSPPSVEPVAWRLAVASFRVAADDPLAGHKTCSKLLNVLARAEAESRGMDEAILVNTRGDFVETSSGNLFWVAEGRLWTVPLGLGLLPGVTRTVIFEVARELGLPLGECRITMDDVAQLEAALVTVTSLGVVDVSEIEGVRMPGSPWVARLYRCYWDRVAAETKTG